MFSQNPGRGRVYGQSGRGGDLDRRGRSRRGRHGRVGGIRGVVLIMARSDIRARARGERGGMHPRQYLVWVVDHERKIGERIEAFEAAFIGVVRKDWSIIHLFFHQSKAADFSGDRGTASRADLRPLLT